MKQSITIQNLKCAGCAASIEKALRRFPEVSGVAVDFEKGEVAFESALPGQLVKYRAALRRAGYPPEGEENRLADKAKSYVSCAIGRATS